MSRVGLPVRVRHVTSKSETYNLETIDDEQHSRLVYPGTH